MLLAPFLWIFCEFDEKVLDNLSLVIYALSDFLIMVFVMVSEAVT